MLKLGPKTPSHFNFVYSCIHATNLLKHEIIYMKKMVIIYMKKLLDSDWLRAVQFKCNTSAISVTPVQITTISEVSLDKPG